MQKLMSGHAILMILGCLLFVIRNVSSHSEQEFAASRTKRSENKRSCLQEKSQCRGNATCKKAYDRIFKKCAAENGGKCSADEQDIDRCVDDIEMLQSHSFSIYNMCECDYHPISQNSKLQRCALVFNNVHFNPCYDLGLKLRRQANQTSTTAAQTTKLVSETKEILYPLHVLLLTSDGSTVQTLHATKTTSQPLTTKQQSSSQTSFLLKNLTPQANHQIEATTGSANWLLSCSDKLLITGGVFLFVAVAMSIGTFIYCKRKRNSQYTKATALKKSSFHITYQKNQNEYWNNSNNQ